MSKRKVMTWLLAALALIMLVATANRLLDRMNQKASLRLLTGTMPSSGRGVTLPIGTQSAVVLKGDSLTTVRRSGGGVRVKTEYVPPESGAVVRVTPTGDVEPIIATLGYGMFPGIGAGLRDDGRFGILLDLRVAYWNRCGLDVGLFLQRAPFIAPYAGASYTIGVGWFQNTSVVLAMDLARRSILGLRVRF